MTIPNNIQEFVRRRANFRCEYCHYPEVLSTSPLTIDHIHPQSLGGSDDVNNLALACRRCNERHYNFTVGIDPETKQEVALFNPRQQQWAEHFIWSGDATKVIGITAIGRATCNRFDLNDERRPDLFIQKSRQLWVKRFWILDLRFWIDPVHKGTGLGDFRLSILDLFRPNMAGLEPKNNSIFQNPKSKIGTVKGGFHPPPEDPRQES